MRIHCPFRRRTASGYILLVIIALALIMWYFFRVSYRKEVLESLRKRNTSALVLPNFDTTIIQTLSQCKPTHNTFILAVIVIPSKAEDTKIRNQIRSHWNGWGLEENSLQGFRLVFFIGLPKDNDLGSLLEESAKYDDIVVDLMIDSYYALTLKTLRILKWFLKNCMDAHFFVKTDVDILIHLPNLIKFLHSLESHRQEQEVQTFIGGDLAMNTYPITDEHEKWYIPPEILPSINVKQGSPFPDYVRGGFYILSVPLIPTLYKESLRVPMLNYEDLFLTGFIANRNLGYKLTKIQNVFSNDPPGCIYSATHYTHNSKIIACGFHKETQYLNLYYDNYQRQYRSNLSGLTNRPPFWRTFLLWR